MRSLFVLIIFSIFIFHVNAANAARPRTHDHKIARPIKGNAIKETNKNVVFEKNKASEVWKQPSKGAERSKKYDRLRNKLYGRSEKRMKITPDLSAHHNKVTKPEKKLSRDFYVARDGYPKNDGFDEKRKIRDLQKGEILARKGDENGKYLTRNLNPKDGALSLDPKSDAQKLTYYKVLKKFPVIEGKAAAWWSQKGGANQIMSRYSVADLIKNGYIKKIERD